MLYEVITPIFINFLVPQQQLPLIRIGYPVRLTSDGLPPGRVVEGTVTAINPDVDATSRNVRIQAVITSYSIHYTKLYE